jgi:hypothetical protein
VASNAILEGKGARTGLIDEGFPRRAEIVAGCRLYDLTWTSRPAGRALRREVTERVDANSRVETSSPSRGRAGAARSAGRRRVAGGLPDQLLRESDPKEDQGDVSASRRTSDLLQHQVLPESQYSSRRRPSSALRDADRRTLPSHLRAGLDDAGVRTPLLIMQATAASRPMPP